MRLPDRDTPDLSKRRTGLLLVGGTQRLPKGHFNLLAIRLGFSGSVRELGHVLLERTQHHSRYL